MSKWRAKRYHVFQNFVACFPMDITSRFTTLLVPFMPKWGRVYLLKLHSTFYCHFKFHSCCCNNFNCHITCFLKTLKHHSCNILILLHCQSNYWNSCVRLCKYDMQMVISPLLSLPYFCGPCVGNLNLYIGHRISPQFLSICKTPQVLPSQEYILVTMIFHWS
jgi:hypothetical protein